LIREQQGDIMHMNGLHNGVYFLKLSPMQTMHTIHHHP